MLYKREKNDDPAKGVAILLQDELGRIALQLRDDGPGVRDPDQWGLFAGLMQATSQPEEEIVREVEEELECSLDPEKLTFVKVFQAWNDECWLDNYVFSYPVSHELDNAVLKEGQEYRFFPWKEIQRGHLRGKKIISFHHMIIEWYFQGGTGETSTH